MIAESNWKLKIEKNKKDYETKQYQSQPLFTISRTTSANITKKSFEYRC